MRVLIQTLTGKGNALACGFAAATGGLCYGFNGFWRQITLVLGRDATSLPAGDDSLWGRL